MDIATAQRDVRRAYLRGGPGALVSGVVWLFSGIVATWKDVPSGFAVLFLGGMFIFPVTQLLLRRVFGRANISKDNPNGLIVIETLFPMIGGFFAAWLLIPYQPDFVFPMSAIAVGTHYFGFRSAYGDWANWILGGAMSTVGASAILYRLPVPAIIPFVIAALEITFGLWFTWIGIAKEGKAESCSASETGRT